MDTAPRKIFSLKLTPAEKEELRAYAKRQGYGNMSDMMRTKLLQLARQDQQQRAA